MKITYANLRGFKRFHLNKITEFEAEFHAPVTVICGLSGTGKTSLLKELNPLPSVRTDYEKDGRKEIHLTHDGHLYQAISDFTNRVSPHSFVMDGVELNQGHTTDVQMELVAQHFGLTPAIRDLIYNKTEVCSLTKANRKALFMSINPLDLSLIIPAFKTAMSDFKDCKANLQLLYSRKSELESKMIQPEILEQHLKTKEELNNQLLEIDKILYMLEQHIRSLKVKYADDLNYRQQCVNSNRPLLPGNEILQQCKTVLSKITKWSDIPRGDEFIQAQANLKATQEQLKAKKLDIAATIKTLAQEIDEYHKHLENAAGRPISRIEDELKTLEEQLQKYQHLPSNPIPYQLLDQYRNMLTTLSELLYVFRDSEVKMLEPEILRSQLQQQQQLTQQVTEVTYQLQQLTQLITEEKTELDKHTSQASIPEDCTSSICGLKILFQQRLSKVQLSYQQHVEQQTKLSQQLTELTQTRDNLVRKLTPYVKNDLLNRYQTLLTCLKSDIYLNWRKWDEELLSLVQTQPFKIVQELQELIDGSLAAHEQQQLLQQKQKLTTELEVLMSTSGASLDFLTSKLKEKESQLTEKLSQLDDISHNLDNVDALCASYLEYSTALTDITKLQASYQQGERALVIAQAITYWSSLGRKFTEAKSLIAEDLRKLETIVQEQQVLRKTYKSETLGLISGIEEDKKIYDLIAQALSPNSGFPHKSMVRYLNALINNVNYFLSQIWTYKLRLLPISQDVNLDYGFKIEVSNDVTPDISLLSEGQTEIVNLVWVLTILLQMKMLNKIPLYADELGRAFDATHRFKLLGFLNQLIDSKYIEQMFLVSHYSVFTTGFTDSDVICLSPDQTTDLPQGVNEHVKLS